MKKSKSSFSSKPLSYKIAYVIVFILILLLFTGAVGGNIYLFKSMRRNNITASAEGVSGSTEQYYTQNVALNTSYINMYIEGRYPANGEVLINTFWNVQYQREVYEGEENSYFLFSSSYYDNTGQVYMLQSYSSESYFLPLVVGDDFSFLVGGIAFANQTPELVNLNFYCECVDLVYAGYSYFDYIAQVVFSYISTDSIPTIESSPPMLLEIYDINGSYIKYEISLERYPYSFYYNSPRYVYDVQVPSTEGADTLYNRGFKAGFERATAELEADIQEAYDRGSHDGELIGYDRGLREQNLFTFDKLANAVVFAPVKTFVSLFNFEILGYNMLSFASFVLTAIVVFGILKFFL